MTNAIAHRTIQFCQLMTLAGVFFVFGYVMICGNDYDIWLPFSIAVTTVFGLSWLSLEKIFDIRVD